MILDMRITFNEGGAFGHAYAVRPQGLFFPDKRTMSNRIRDSSYSMHAVGVIDTNYNTMANLARSSVPQLKYLETTKNAYFVPRARPIIGRSAQMIRIPASLGMSC